MLVSWCDDSDGPHRRVLVFLCGEAAAAAGKKFTNTPEESTDASFLTLFQKVLTDIWKWQHFDDYSYSACHRRTHIYHISHNRNNLDVEVSRPTLTTVLLCHVSAHIFQNLNGLETQNHVREPKQHLLYSRNHWRYPEWITIRCNAIEHDTKLIQTPPPNITFFRTSIDCCVSPWGDGDQKWLLGHSQWPCWVSHLRVQAPPWVLQPPGGCSESLLGIWMQQWSLETLGKAEPGLRWPQW